MALRARARRRLAAFLPMLAAVGGCTTIGVDTAEVRKVDFGEPVSLEICLLKHPDVKQERADRFIASVNKEFADFGITVTVPWVRDWERPAFTVDGIMKDILSRELEAPCDRLMALVDRHAGDFLWGLLLPEVLGAVDSQTRTRGYIVANFASLNQAFAPVELAAVHEFYHLVGCGHHVSKSKCYHAISALKASRPAESDFLPGVSEAGDYILTRESANQVIAKYLAEETAKKSPPGK